MEAESENAAAVAPKISKPKSEARIAYEKRKKANQKANQKKRAEQAAQDDSIEQDASQPRTRMELSSEHTLPGSQRHKKARFVAPVFEPEHILYVNSPEKWDPTALRAGIQLVEFGPAFDVQDSHLQDLADASPEFREGLCALYAGSDETENKIRRDDGRISISEKMLCHFLACGLPKLEHVRLLWLDGSDYGYTNALSVLMRSPTIKSIILSTMQPSFMSGVSIYPIMQMGSKNLKYLELINVDVDDSIEPYLPALTRKVPGLEFVFGPDRKNAVLWRDARTV